MINRILIDKLDDLIPLLVEQEYRPEMDRNRNQFLYRGMPRASYRITTSLYRNCKGHQKELEPVILKNFTKYAAMEHPEIERSVWRQMFLGQHHGLPTRLLDWSFSPLVALHFAVTESNMDKMERHDCALWRMDMSELMRLLPERFQNKLRENNTVVFSADMLAELAPNIGVYDSAMQNSAMVIIEPPSIDLRIINQYSFFSIVPAGIEDVEAFLDAHTEHTYKYTIRKELRWRVRDMLDQFNMSERIVYPGLDGLSRWLARSYFVK
ncbi:MAG: FRG domain-containing protein [Lachnospiraceae bacterium]|nr:FRG domain-containing protein [Lachnospiraceae bacterium]